MFLSFLLPCYCFSSPISLVRFWGSLKLCRMQFLWACVYSSVREVWRFLYQELIISCSLCSLWHCWFSSAAAARCYSRSQRFPGMQSMLIPHHHQVRWDRYQYLDQSPEKLEHWTHTLFFFPCCWSSKWVPSPDCAQLCWPVALQALWGCRKTFLLSLAFSGPRMSNICQFCECWSSQWSFESVNTGTSVSPEAF